MTTHRAADLPLGSIAADARIIYIRVTGTFPWTVVGEDGYAFDADHGDVEVAFDGGAEVLRVGDGSGQ